MDKKSLKDIIKKIAGDILGKTPSEEIAPEYELELDPEDETPEEAAKRLRREANAYSKDQLLEKYSDEEKVNIPVAE